MNKRTSSFREWIITYAAERQGRETLLPAHRDLAAEWGISETTVRRQLARLSRDIPMQTIPGKGTFLYPARPSPPDQPDSRNHASPSAAIADHITDEITHGRLRTGDPLPSGKRLRIQFSTSPEQVTRAYRILQQRKLSIKIGKKYWVGAFAHIAGERPAHTVAVCSFLENEFASLEALPFHMPLYREIESEMGRSNAVIRRIPKKRILRYLSGLTEGDVLPRAVLLVDYGVRAFQATIGHIKKLTALYHGDAPRAVYIGNMVDARISGNVHYFCIGSMPKEIARRLVEYVMMEKICRVHFVFNEPKSVITAFRVALFFYGEMVHRMPHIPVRFHIVSDRDYADGSEFLRAMPSYADHGYGYLESILSKKKRVPIETIFPLFSVYESVDKIKPPAEKNALVVSCDTETARELLSQKSSVRVVTTSEDDRAVCEDIATCYPDLKRAGYLIARACLKDAPVARTSRGYMPIPVSLKRRGTG